MAVVIHRHVLCSFIVALALFGALGACSGGGPVEWKETELDGAEAYYSSVWGSSSKDVFVVGGVRRGTVHHFDGSGWREMDIPFRTPALIWVFGFGPDDVYAVGEAGAFLHYDGESWSTLDSNTAKTLWGVWGTAPDDLWLVGGEIDRGRPTIRRWNGTESEVHEIDPEQYADDVHALFKVWGDGSSVYAVGQAGTILAYSGESWARVPAGEEATGDFIAIWGTGPGDVVAVGGRGRAQIARYDGEAFQTVTPEGVGGLAAVYACDDRVVVGGDANAVGDADPSTGEVEVQVSTGNPIHGIWSDCDGTTYAVGGLFSDPPRRGVVVVER